MNKPIDLLLDEDEKVIKEFKPNKKRFVILSNIIYGILLVITVTVFTIIAIIVVPDNEADTIPMKATFGFLAAFFLILFGSLMISNIVTYKKTFYCYTNKRLIIRSGFIGADYKSLELNSIGAVNVNVDFLDKLTHDTGTLSFGSMSAPIGHNQDGVKQASFEFNHIDDPYDLYKEIKSYIADSKKEK